MKKLLISFLALMAVVFTASATKIYINPGHGSWSANCRHMGLINVPVGSSDANGYYSGNDTLGFFESNTNLWKGLFLEKKLLEKGYQVKMSRRYSGGTNELESSPYDKALHVIGAESQAYGSDYFISIHSNAHIDGYTTNYPVFIHKGYDGSDTNSGSIWGEQILWDHHFKIFSSGMEPYSYYSATNKCIRGGLSMNGWDYGVLRTQDRPGTLVEGYFHTYQPARHRAMNTDWCRQEGLRYFRGFTQMYGTAKDTKGYIMGYVRTKDKQINQTNYTGRAGNDIYYPLNGAKIVLRNASGQIIKTDNYKYVVRDAVNQNKSYYTTDNYYNGVFVFDDLTPGTYTISVHCAGYADVKQTLTVTAHETTYTQVFMTAGSGTEPDVNEIQGTSGLNPYAYDLSSSWDESTQKLTVKFSLNADAYVDGAGGYADGVQIYLTDDKANPKKYYVYGLSKAECKQGQNKSFTIDLSSGKDKNGNVIPHGRTLYASVTVQGDRSNTAPREYSLSHRIKYPNGIAVDKNPDSKNFGKIFVNEAYQYAQGGELTEYFTKGLAGMYVLDADFAQRSSTRYTGGYDFSWWVIDNTYSSLARKGYQPWCVRVSDEGRIFVCSNDMHQRQTTQNANGERDGVAVWEVDRNNFNNWTPVLKGYRRFTSGQTGTNYTFSYKDVNGVEQFIGPICGMDVKGTGDNLTLLLYTVNQAGVWLDMNGFRAYEYNVKSGALKPVPAFNNGGYGLVFEYVSLRYGLDGSYWFGGSRADGSDGVEGNGKTKEPNLGHVKLDGTTADYTNYNSEFYGGAGMVIYKSSYNNAACNAENHTWLVTGKDNSAGSDGLFDVFIVSSSAGGGAGVTRMDGNSGRPNWQKITASGMGRNLNDMAVDYAENLYIVSSSGGIVRAYAMPYCGEKTTTVRNEYSFKLPGYSMTWHPYPKGYTATNLDLMDQFVEDTVGQNLATLLTNASSAWKWLGDYILTVDANVATNGTWAQAINDFFAAQGAYATAGQPAQWQQKWWDATFKNVLENGDPMPKVKRHGWELEDWRYGNTGGYYYFSEDSKVKNNAFDAAKADSAHIWARWVEVCLYEGYETYIHSEDTSAIDLRAWALNTNEDMLVLTNGKTIDMPVKRTLSGNAYNAMALPFVLTRETIKQVTDEAGNHIFDPEQGGKEPELYLYKAAKILTQDTTTELQIQVRAWGKDEVLQPTTPFIIKPQDAISGKIIFHNVTITQNNAYTPAEGEVQFIGINSPGSVTPAENSKLIRIMEEGGEIQQFTEKTSFPGVNGYFTVAATVAPYDTVTIRPVADITYHPYPLGYIPSNKDLWEQFVEDYNAWYAITDYHYMPLTSALEFISPAATPQVMSLLTDVTSTWKWLGNYLLAVDNTLMDEAGYAQALCDFFQATGLYTTKGQAQPQEDATAGWYQTWYNALCPAQVFGGEQIPSVKRYGWSLEDWRYGNSDGYYYFSEESKAAAAIEVNKADSAHIWARWIETCLYDGFEPYLESGDTSAIDLKEYGGGNLNANEDLLILINNKTVNLAIERPLTANEYNAVCVPFAVSRETIANAYDPEGNMPFNPETAGQTPDIYVYDGTATTVVNSEAESVLQINFHLLKEEEEIPANTLFLIQPKTDITTKLIFDQMYIEPKAETVLGEDIALVGLLAPTHYIVSTDEYSALAIEGDGRLSKIETYTTIGGVDGYIAVPTTGYSYDYAVIHVEDNTATSQPNEWLNNIINNTRKVLYNNHLYILRNGIIYTIEGQIIQ